MTGSEQTYVGQVASPGYEGVEDWTTVVTDPDQQYVAHCLRWQGYSGLRHRIVLESDLASEARS